jgi:hypothetical protein
LRKRKYVIGAIVVVVALATAAVALAVTQRTYRQNFAATATGAPTKAKGKPTGSYFVETANDPTNPQNHQPRQDASVDDIFPPGTVLDQSIPANCTATDNDFKNKGPSACPSKSKVGSGNATLKTNNAANPDIHATILAYNNKTAKQLVFYINPSPAQPIVLRGTVKKSASGNYSLHVPIPINCVLGTPPSCNPNPQLGDARITRFELTIDKVTKTVSGKTKGFVTTPKTCPASKNWVFTIKFNGRNGAPTQTLTSKSPCNP